MEIRQLSYFISIVKHKNFTLAAEEHHISQSAISQQIKLLEEELNTKLLIREKRSFKLTPAGEYLYREGIGLIDEINRLKNETMAIGDYEDQSLSIGLINGFGHQEMIKAIGELSQLYPEIMWDIKTGTHEELYDMLINDRVDIVLNDHRRKFNNDYMNYHLIDSPTYIKISKHNPLSELQYLTMNDLKRLPCILLASDNQMENEKDYYERTLGFNGNFIFASNETIADMMIAANKGFRPVESYNSQLDSIDFIPLYSGNIAFTRHYCLFWKKEKTTYYIEELASTLYKIFNH